MSTPNTSSRNLLITLGVVLMAVCACVAGAYALMVAVPALLLLNQRQAAQATPLPTLNPTQIVETMDEIQIYVITTRGLQPKEPVERTFLTVAEVKQRVLDDFEDDYSPAEAGDDLRVLTAFGLVPPGLDLYNLFVRLYSEGVAGYYDPDTHELVLVSEAQGLNAYERTVFAHEYTHALQDQHFDLEGTRIKDLSQGDAVLGQLAAKEGDATKTMQLWAQNNLSPEELLEVLFGSIGQLGDPTLTNMPPILRRQLEFPYSEGFTFVQDVYSSGGFAAVNQTLQDAPESTKQILHPDSYYADEAPVDVDVPDMLSTLGNGWYDAYEQTLGELMMQVWLAGDETPEVAIPGFPVEWPHAEAAAGWGGDRLRMYESMDSRWVIEWETAWDTSTDASEFAARANELKSSFDGVAVVLDGRPDGHVLLLVASDQETLTAVT